MSSSYTYSLATDFPSGLDPADLHHQIVIAIPTATLLGVTQDGDDVTLDFQDPLSSGDLDALNALIAAYTYMPPVIVRYDSLQLTQNKVTSDEYQVIGVYNYPGSNSYMIGNIVMGAWMEGNITSYDVRIYDKISDEYISTQNFSNTDRGNIVLGNLTNMPLYSGFFEFQVKRNGGNQFGTINIEFANLNY